MVDWFYIGYCVAIAECVAFLAWLAKVNYHALRKLSLSHLLALSILAFGTSLDAQKTNQLLRVIGGFLWRGMMGETVEVCDIARGWRVESVTTNATVSYAMPTNAVYAGNWHIHGAASSFGNNRIDFGDWRFPLGTNSATFSSFWCFIDGRIRPTPKDAVREICAVGVPMSAVPGQSRLWRLDGDDGSRILTWENFFIGGDTNAPVNAQIILRPNGDFITRSNEVETAYRRVNPDDWDDDGIPNDEDVNPTVCDGDFFGPANVLPEGANTNAYCTVSLVATGPDALVAFAGDKPGNYPDPRFVAKSGVTNEVVILIGKTYAISSDWPFAVVGVSDPDTEVWQMRGSAHQTYVCRPVTISASDGNPFTMSVVPLNLGGVFLWPSAQCGCSISGSGNTFMWNCPMDCTCCGCAVEGRYSYEGYWLPATSCLCGCHYDGTGPTWEPSSAPLAASVSASFSKSAVIFEDAYENEPGQWVGKNSTRARLNIVANGGPNGGTLSVASTNLAKLTRISGPDLPLASVAVPAETQVSYAIVYEGHEASTITNDIYVTTLFSENDGGTNLHDSATLTCMRVALDVDKIAPDNYCTNRHVYGVCELVHLRHCPESLEVEWTTMDASLIIDNDTTLRCHYLPGNSLLRAEFGAASLDIDFEIVAPKRIVCRGARWDGVVGQAGVAGDVTMELPLYVEPTNVSFEGLPIQEIIDDSQSGYHDGYFDDRTKGGSWSHDYASGAGDWHIVSTNGYWFTDRAGVRGSPSYVQPWINGRKEWAIPVGWSTPLGMEAVGSISPNPTTQTFIIDTNGTVRVLKYGHEIKRSTDGKVWLDGLRVN